MKPSSFQSLFNRGIKSKIVFLVLFCVAGLAASAAVQHLTLRTVTGQIESAIRASAEQSNATSAFSRTIFDAQADLQAFIRERDPDKLEAQLNKLKPALQQLRTSAGALLSESDTSAAKNDKLVEATRGLVDRTQAWSSKADEVIEKVLMGDNGFANTLFINDLMPLQSGLTTALDKLTAERNAASIESVHATNESAAALGMKTSIGIGIGAIVLGVAGVLTAQRMSTPLKQAIEMLLGNADQVSKAADVVNSAAQQSATSATEQTATIDETAQSLTAFAELVEASTRSSREADSLAISARDSAGASKEVMEQLDASIHSIDESASQMAKIIRVIEEIAFQTNLLALNAAVEAARAGEHGKGFAVVAEEVQNLARRSADAARETGNLIGQSVQRAQDGVRICGSVRSELDKVVTTIRQVAEQLTQIRTASESQSTQVKAMRDTVGTIGQVTSKAAGAAEESASAAEELTALAESLRSKTVAQLSEVVLGRRAA